MSQPLSPAAQEVLDAWLSSERGERMLGDPACLAAALRAAADQVVPEQDSPDAEEWLGQSSWIQAEQGVRFRLRAIATELEGTRLAALEPPADEITNTNHTTP